MRSLSGWLIAVFASPLGVAVLGALDSTLFFSFPLGIDAAVIIASARLREAAWIVPLLATGGSLAGAALTFWMGIQIGEKGLDRFASADRLDRVRRRIRDSGALTLAVLDLVPPPFPFTLFVLGAGALEVSGPVFFVTLSVCRLFRFGIEAWLATRYGSSLVRVFDSDTFHDIVFGMIVLAFVLTAVSLVKLARSTKRTHRGASV
jgi:membrane protein YqaA with SNARE-associated domain